MTYRPYLIFLVALLACALTVVPAGAATGAEKPRLLVLTDISNEPDDEESLVRLLVYANEFDIEGLIATTSVWLRNKTRPDIIHRSIEAYGKVRDNLERHAPGYPSAPYLSSIVKNGSTEFGMAGVGEGKTSEGAQFLIQLADRPDPRPLWVSVWGGANTLAQALWQVKYSRSAEELAKFVSKLRVYTISDQDNAGRWLRITFPDLYYIVSPSTVDGAEYYLATWTGISGDRHYRNGPFENFHLVDHDWLRANIVDNHGPLWALYPLPPYIMEGDTPAFLGLINNGLASHVSSTWGGWGGRYELRQSYGETRPIYTNSRDTVTLQDGRSYTSNQATIWRWREAYQHDFAARMDWCVQPPEQANHNPIAVVNGQAGKDVLRIDARPGQSISLSAEGSRDPDGNQLSYRWFYYPEAGTYRPQGPVTLEGANTARASFTVPPSKGAGEMHVILELRDDGQPALHAYRRVIVNVKP
jgi:hypothetical protein